MCYSAQVQADYKKYVVMFGATMSIRDFYEIFYRRGLDPKIKIPKAVEASFGDPQSDDERAIKALIDDFNDKQATKFEEELFKQRKRLADAERILQTKPTKKAQDDQRIATDKVKQLMGRHADLKRTELRDRDSRIFPGWYVPVMVWEDGNRVIKPMRYGCRPAGKPESPCASGGTCTTATGLATVLAEATRVLPSTSSTRAPTTPGATTCRGSGRTSSATRTGSSWSTRSTRT